MVIFMVYREETRIKNKNEICMVKFNDEIICVDPAIPLMAILGKKYSMLILSVLEQNNIKRNFNEILKHIPYSSTTIISKRLKDLEYLNLIKKINSTDGIYYNLTDYGSKIIKSLYGFFKAVE